MGFSLQSCQAEGCNNNRRNCKLAFFNMNKNSSKRKKWLTNIQCKKPIPNRFALCSDHFDNKTFTCSLKQRLHPSAVPTIQLPGLQGPLKYPCLDGCRDFSCVNLLAPDIKMETEDDEEGAMTNATSLQNSKTELSIPVQIKIEEVANVLNEINMTYEEEKSRKKSRLARRRLRCLNKDTTCRPTEKRKFGKDSARRRKLTPAQQQRSKLRKVLKELVIKATRATSSDGHGVFSNGQESNSDQELTSRSLQQHRSNAILQSMRISDEENSILQNVPSPVELSPRSSSVNRSISTEMRITDSGHNSDLPLQFSTSKAQLEPSETQQLNTFPTQEPNATQLCSELSQFTPNLTEKINLSQTQLSAIATAVNRFTDSECYSVQNISGPNLRRSKGSRFIINSLKRKKKATEEVNDLISPLLLQPGATPKLDVYRLSEKATKINQYKAFLHRVKKKILFKKTFRPVSCTKKFVFDHLKSRLNPPLFNIMASQLRNANRRPLSRRWTTQDKAFAVDIYRSSSKAYRVLQKYLCLPTIKTIREAERKSRSEITPKTVSPATDDSSRPVVHYFVLPHEYSVRPA